MPTTTEQDKNVPETDATGAVIPLQLDPLGVPLGYLSVDNGPISQPVIPTGDFSLPEPAAPVVVEEVDTWPPKDDPTGDKLLREEVVEEQIANIKRYFDLQVRQHISAAEWDEVQARLKKWL